MISTLILSLVFITTGAAPSSGAPAYIHHACMVSLDPATGGIAVTDTLSFPASPGTSISFLLNRDLAMDGVPDSVRYSYAGLEEIDEFPVARIVTLSAPAPLPASLVVSYSGVISDTLHAAENYARGFATTSGIIDTAGVFLSGRTCWLPTFEDSLLTFSLSVDLPPGWQSVSQGRSVEHGDLQRWDCPHPMEEAYLVAGRYWRSQVSCDDVESEIYLFEPDSSLASSYHAATCRYLDMYSDLIGAYPYSKFALVENFWQTGYGMPSFTLLGGIVIRLPFIIHTSYGHEILHNWWGNGVYVDWDRGNWCEGITSYMADHYYKELRGSDEEHRQKLLLHYLWYAADRDDLPLTRFTGRHSSNTEAVGYGKSAMVFHMIRERLGDDLFYAALGSFWDEFRFRKASWYDILHAFEGESGESFEDFISQWIERAGAPAIQVTDAILSGGDLRIILTQESPVYVLSVPVALSYPGPEGDSVSVHSIALNDGTADTVLASVGEPARVHIDPEFDIFRVIDPREAPPGLGHLFGVDTVYVRAAVDSSLADLISDGLPVTCITDNDAADVPESPESDIGFLNLLYWRDYPRGLSSVEREILDESRMDELPSNSDQMLIIASISEHHRPGISIVMGEDASVTTISSVIRKLVHYDTYTALVFSGDRCTDKHRVNPWDNPMTVSLTKE